MTSCFLWAFRLPTKNISHRSLLIGLVIDFIISIAIICESQQSAWITHNVHRFNKQFLHILSRIETSELAEASATHYVLSEYFYGKNVWHFLPYLFLCAFLLVCFLVSRGFGLSILCTCWKTDPLIRRKIKVTKENMHSHFLRSARSKASDWKN